MIRLQVNRAKQLFSQAAASLEVEVSNRTDLPIFTYWCKFFPENPDEDETSIKLIEPEVYNSLESKSKLNNLVKKNNISGVFPATYNSIQEAVAHQGTVDIWFVKPSHLSGGRGIQVVSNDQLPRFNLPQYNIIQEGIENMSLIKGRKFTSRIYVLIWNKTLFLFDEGFILIHAPLYIPGSTDYAVQVDHRGFQEDRANGVEMKPLSQLNISKDLLVKSAAAVGKLRPVFKQTLEASSHLRYILLGIDLLVLQNGGIRFIEINAIPNFVHSPGINHQVNIPLFTHMMRLIYGLGTSRFKIIQKIRGAED